MVPLGLTFGNLIIRSIAKLAVAAFNYNKQSRNRNIINNHIRMMFRMVSSTSSVKIINSADKVKQESTENTNNDVLMDDFNNRKTHGLDVLAEALGRKGVTHIWYSLYNDRYFADFLCHCKGIEVNWYTDLTYTYYIAMGFAVADQGHRDRPGVCCIPADSGLIVNDVLVKSGRAPVVFILVPFDKDAEPYRLRFNDDALMSLPHYYRVSDVKDITTTVHQAFSSAYNEPGGPVFIDIQRLLLDHVDFKEEEDLRTEAEIVVDILLDHEGPYAFLYVSSSLDDGVEQENKELSRFLELTGIPVTRSLISLGNRGLVLYVGATCNDLPEIVAMNEGITVLLIDVGDVDEMQKFIKPRGRLTAFPTFKDINEILVAKEKKISDCYSIFGKSLIKFQIQSEYMLASCYADIISTTTANNDKRITREFATRVLDEFFEENKEKVMAFRAHNDCWIMKDGAKTAWARANNDVYLVIDGFEKGEVVHNYSGNCVILDNSGWTKCFYQNVGEYVVGVDDIVGEIVTDKCDLKDALYQYHKSPLRYRRSLVVAVVPPSDRLTEEGFPNFSRDLRFLHYPNVYFRIFVDVDRSPPTD